MAIRIIKNVPHVMPFQKRCKTFDFTYSFNDGFSNCNQNASKFLHVRLSLGAGIRVSHANKWLMLLNKCLAGSVSSAGLLGSLQRFSTILSISTMYSFPHEHLPLYITQEGLVSASNFSIKCLESFSFSSQHGSSTKINGLLSSKRSGGIINEFYF